MICQGYRCAAEASVRVMDNRLIVRDLCRPCGVFFWENTFPGTRVGFPLAEVAA